MADQDRSAGWIEGYAEGLVDGLAAPRGVEVLATCTCGVMSGGIRTPSKSCGLHSAAGGAPKAAEA